jgi:hypothetical protein
VNKNEAIRECSSTREARMLEHMGYHVLEHKGYHVLEHMGYHVLEHTGYHVLEHLGYDVLEHIKTLKRRCDVENSRHARV